MRSTSFKQNTDNLIDANSDYSTTDYLLRLKDCKKSVALFNKMKKYCNHI